MNYYVILTCRNSEKTIENAILSLQNQTIKPSYIIVIDDGSTDNTAAILSDIQRVCSNVHVITNPDLGSDIGRVVCNWNKAIEYAQCLAKTDYHMISADDILYNSDYVETLLSEMEQNKSLAVTSGRLSDHKTAMPRGAGRLVRNTFFAGPYPEKMGYESWIVHKAMIEGKKVKVIYLAIGEHVRPLGANHHFYEFGASMKALGYHPLFVLGRFGLYLLTGYPIGRLGALYMLYYYLKFKPQKDGYKSMHDQDFRKQVSRLQIKRMLGI